MSGLLSIEADKKIAIYGAGTVANVFYYFLQQNGYEDRICCFLVSDLRGSEITKFGYPKFQFDSVVDKLSDTKVYIATQESLQNEIKCKIHGYKDISYQIVNTRDLIDQFYNNLENDPINPYKILGQNQQVAGYGDNPKYIFEELHRRDTCGILDLVWSVAEHDSTIPDYVRQVEYGSYDYYKELTTAHIWLDNERKPQLIRKRKDQIYIQTWHGAAPIKMVEADAEKSLEKFYIEGAKHDSEMADLFISGSEFYTELYRRSFWYDGEILKVGLPRQDVFWKQDEVRKRIYAKYNIGENKYTVLYAPTYRSKYTEGCYDLDIANVLSALKERFNHSFVMLVSRHPVNYQEYNFGGQAFISIDKSQDFEELLAAVDVLITDYSGCMYDFSYTERPVFLFQQDYDVYVEDRDFYIPIHELPYICARSNWELVDKIRTFNYDNYKKDLRRFMNSMGNYDDGTASKRTVDYILDNYLQV